MCGFPVADENTRLSEANIIRTDADNLGNVNVIYGGDFNWNSSDERGANVDSAWDLIVDDGIGQGFDAFDTTNVSGAGDWRDNENFKALHTQDPGGSMDDRFDVQFVSNELFDGTGLELLQGSYRVFGNNGTHDLNGLITTGTGASFDVLMVLANFSDHLPVMSDFEFHAVPEPSSFVLLLGTLGVACARRLRRRHAPESKPDQLALF